MRRTPQEKKALSYARDRRRSYLQNNKGARRTIRRRKRFPRRADRHREHQVFTSALGAVDTELAERAENRLNAARPRRWRKWPDQPLGTFVTGRLERRVEIGMINPEHLDRRVRRGQSVPGRWR
ncbi:hypothetical protein BLA60_31745 [Actinophytocola xinjiangensis]|uniref:Uncharacterized protein n=1 Tax=Actinophytocola xinjiangensis TaxID=485602 RepID=A0A7Z0WGB3_9PSEU|nr:hypothetical protein [Actinophytocola xinjiangensis]OLF06540.1 hypothetical protein BLA60_31745 [Actinophytocola xinjiangensis]